MHISQIQQQLHINRTLLAVNHDMLLWRIERRNDHRAQGDDILAEQEHKTIVHIRKVIARYAALQKALKFDLACIVHRNRRSQEINQEVRD